MEPRASKPRRVLRAMLAASLILIVVIVLWVYTAPYRFSSRPLPPGSPVSIIAWASYVNDTGTIRGTRYVEGVNITFYDTNTGTFLSILTVPKILDLILVVGHNYHATATLGPSSKSADTIVGGNGGYVNVSVSDNGTIRSIDIGMVTH